MRKWLPRFFCVAALEIANQIRYNMDKHIVYETSLSI